MRGIVTGFFAAVFAFPLAAQDAASIEFDVRARENLLFGVGEIFHSNVWWSRAFAFRDKVGARAYTLAGLCWLPIPIVAGFIALAAPSLGLQVPSADMVGPSGNIDHRPVRVRND